MITSGSQRDVPTDERTLVTGIRQFVVGTGGASLRGPGAARANGSEVFDAATHGVLRLTLHPTSYRWEFVPVAGGTFTDQGGGRCHGIPG